MKLNWLISWINLINGINIQSQIINSATTFVWCDSNNFKDQQTFWLKNKLNMTCEMFLNFLNSSSYQDILNQLKIWGFEFPIGTTKVTFKNATIMQDQSNHFILNLSLKIYFKKIQIIRSLSIDSNMFEIQFLIPKQIDLTFNEFQKEIQNLTVQKINCFLNKYQFQISNNLLKLKILDFQIDAQNRILNLNCLQYDNQLLHHKIIIELKINLNSIKFKQSNSWIDVGSVVGISFSCFFFIFILSFWIGIKIRKSKSNHIDLKPKIKFK